MNSRDRILARLSEGLPAEPQLDFRAMLPKVGPSRADRIARFLELASLRQTEVVTISAGATREWLRAQSLGEILCPAEMEELLADLHPNQVPPEQATTSVTGCVALVAQTGSVAVSSEPGRALSCLAPHHIVLARASQTVSDLSELFHQVRDQAFFDSHSMLSLITGPSRTADIEATVVLGAHGPTRLTVVIEMNE